eukprot:TRINITY_DN8385_c0_g1_i1.p1 TRINITY_DN8385_c0_g1~~TRINITY_DN8385_c0_g1_i1.p1  ORF type:complete len:160 (+),score=22.56 TRINITY_DN8385_c0_g1_i1:287-766(+)
MANRDYVIQRRVTVHRGQLLVISRTIELTEHPVRSGYVRVTEYSAAQLMIGTAGELERPGVSLRCTYSEDHQLELPGSVCDLAFQERFPASFKRIIVAAVALEAQREIRPPIMPRDKTRTRDKDKQAGLVGAIADTAEGLIAEFDDTHDSAGAGRGCCW